MTKANILIWIFTLLVVANCASHRALDLSALSSDVNSNNNTYNKVWDKTRIISKTSLAIVCVIWALVVCRFFLHFQSDYEYISALMITFALPIFYSILGYVSIVDKDTKGHLDLIRTFYEVILLFGVFHLFKVYVAYDAESGIFRPDVLYEAVRRNGHVSVFKMNPIKANGSCFSFFSLLIHRFKKFFYFPLSTTQEAKKFVQTITLCLWIFGGLRLASLLVDILFNSDDAASLVLETVGIIAMTVAILYSYLFVHAVEKEIPEIKANRKFWSIKIFLSLTFYQGYILEWLLYMRYKAAWEELDPSVRAELLIWVVDALICCEMVVFCLLLACAFSYSNFKNVEVFVGAKLYKKYQEEMKNTEEEKKGAPAPNPSANVIPILNSSQGPKRSSGNKLEIVTATDPSTNATPILTSLQESKKLSASKLQVVTNLERSDSNTKKQSATNPSGSEKSSASEKRIATNPSRPEKLSVSEIQIVANRTSGRNTTQPSKIPNENTVEIVTDIPVESPHRMINIPRSFNTMRAQRVA